LNAKVILALTGIGLPNFAAQGAKPDSLEVTHTTARTTPAFPLKLSADRRYLIEQSDQPFLVIGDSPWSLIVEPTSAQVDQYLELAPPALPHFRQRNDARVVRHAERRRPPLHLQH
jgi:hypothetical protein